MKVLVIHSELGVLRGGGENFTRNLFSAFAERGHEIKAAFVADHKKRYPIPLPSNIEPLPIPGWWSRNAGQEILCFLRACLPANEQLSVAWDRIQEALSWRAARWHDRRFQRRIERDFDHAWNQFDAVYVHASPALARKVARHRPTLLRMPGPASVDLAPVLRQIHAVCANGDALNRIREFLGDHVVELPIGVDTDRFRPGGSSIRSQLDWNENDQVLGYVGRLTHLKGVDILASAFHEISQKIADAKLLVIGHGPEEQFIRSTLAREIAAGRAHIEPGVEHEKLSAWYRAMDLLVMPSRYENFSNTILEAMACGIPFLASDVGGNRLLSESRAGWLFEPGSVCSLRSRIRSILESNGELKARGRLAASYLKHSCTWAASAKRLEDIIVSRLGVKA